MTVAIRTPGWGFYTVGGGIGPGDHRFRPPFVGVVDIWKIFLIRGWDLILPGWCLLYEPKVGVQQAANAVGGSTPCEAISTQGTTVFFPVCWSGIYIWEGFMMQVWDLNRPGPSWPYKLQVEV